MEKKSEIKKIVFDIEGKKIELTWDQAEKLYGLLDPMFRSMPYPIYTPPIIIQERVPYWEGPYCWNGTADDSVKITYTADSNSLNFAVGLLQESEDNDI